MTINTLLTRSLVEINAADAGGTPQAELSELALDTFNMMLDQWNAQGRALFGTLFSQFTITPNLQPHTIGPSGATWTYAIDRPTDIEAASLILNTNAPYPYVPLRKLNSSQWQNMLTPTLTSAVPSAFYYDPVYTGSVGLGAFYLWTVPTTAYQVQIQTKQQLAQVTAAADFVLPQGYYAALMRALARELAGPLRKPWTQAQEKATTDALAIIWSNNQEALPVATWDAGIPTTGSGSGRTQDFIWSCGQLS